MVILGRILQPIGGSAGVVVARIIAVDLFTGERLSRVMSYMTSSRIVEPLFCVPFGGWLTDQFGWRSNFFFILSAAALALVGIFYCIPETSKKLGTRVNKEQLLKDYSELFRDRNFWSNSLQYGFFYSALTIAMGAIPILFAKNYSLSASNSSVALLLISLFLWLVVSCQPDCLKEF